jgi:hypothetical protein
VCTAPVTAQLMMILPVLAAIAPAPSPLPLARATNPANPRGPGFRQ